MLWKEILGWFLAIETGFAILAFFSDDWWEWFQVYNLTALISVIAVAWVGLIKWLITGTLF